MATYTLISSNVLTTTTASVTFSSIPATYTDLVVRISARNVGTSSISTNLSLRFNNSSTNFSNRRLQGDGASATSGSTASDNIPNGMTGSNATASTFSNTEIYIPSYTASQNKPVSISTVVENNATTAYIVSDAFLWSNTTAITTINLDGQFSGFASGSSFYLYGISNA